MTRRARIPPAGAPLAVLLAAGAAAMLAGSAGAQRGRTVHDARSWELARQALVSRTARQLGLVGRTSDDEDLLLALHAHVRRQLHDPDDGIREPPPEVRAWLDDRWVTFSQLSGRRPSRGGGPNIPGDLAASTHAAVHAAVLEATRAGQGELATRILGFARSLVPEPADDLGLVRLREYVDLVRQLPAPPPAALEDLAEIRERLRSELLGARRVSLTGGSTLSELDPCRPADALAKAGDEWKWWPEVLDVEARIDLARLAARLRGRTADQLRALARPERLPSSRAVPCAGRWNLAETKTGSFELSPVESMPYGATLRDPPPLRLVLRPE